MVKDFFVSWEQYQSTKSVKFPTPNPDKPELTIEN